MEQTKRDQETCHDYQAVLKRKEKKGLMHFVGLYVLRKHFLCLRRDSNTQQQHDLVNNVGRTVRLVSGKNHQKGVSSWGKYSRECKGDFPKGKLPEQMYGKQNAGGIHKAITKGSWLRQVCKHYLLKGLRIKRFFPICNHSWSLLPHPEKKLTTLYTAFFSTAGFLILRK